MERHQVEQRVPADGVSMTVTGIISMLVVGTVVGSLGRVVVPGRAWIPLWTTIAVGVVAASTGALLARAIGVSGSSGSACGSW
jgi:uncharacterized membrane protein YeaQ/YmgE (transglycosylase-associated protein family)